jgi:hypothetical protein
MADASTKTPFLNGPETWYTWLPHIKDAAKNAMVWEYIDPDTETPKAVPQEPVYPVLAAEPDAQQASIWIALKSDYDAKMKIYQRVMVAIGNVSNTVKATMNPDYQVFFEEEGIVTLYDRMRTLKKHIAPDDRARDMIITAEYEALKKNLKRRNVDTWLIRFTKVATDAVRHRLPCVDKDRALVDFIEAASIWEEGWATAKMDQVLDAKEGQKPSLSDLMKSFQTRRRYNQGKKAIGRTFATEEVDGIAAATLRGKNPCHKECVCREYHWWRDCPYLNKDVRDPGWVPDKAIERDVQEALKDESLKQLIERNIANGRKTSTDEGNASKRTETHRRSNANRGGAPKGPAWRKPKKGKPKEATVAKDVGEVEDDPLNFANAAAHSASSIEALKDQWILDSGSDVHITNSQQVFKHLEQRQRGQVVAGATTYRVEAAGIAAIKVATPDGVKTMTLPNVAYIPGFMTNIVSLSLLMEQGVHWSTQDGCLTRHGRPIAMVRRLRGHWVLSFNKPQKAGIPDQQGRDEDEYEGLAALFSAITTSECRQCNKSAFATKHSNTDTNLSMLWHARLGHPGIGPLSHLSRAAKDVSTFVINETVCEACQLSKATQQISRSNERETQEEHAFHRISCDLLQLEEGFNGDEYIIHFQCCLTNFGILFCEPRRKGMARVFRLLLAHIKLQYHQRVRIIRIDNETAVGEEVKEYLREQGIVIEPSAPYTPAQNGHAESHGRTLATKARALRLASRLPHDLWPEIVRTAVYLMNRTPTRKLNWKTPFEAVTGNKPSLRHLHIIGSKAYWLMHNIPRKKKLNARASIGYLVGYDSTNIWRIWNPRNGYKIIRTRDVYFDEGQKFDPQDVPHLLQLDSFESHADTISLEVLGDVSEGMQLQEDEDEDDADEVANTTIGHGQRAQTGRGNSPEAPAIARTGNSSDATSENTSYWRSPQSSRTSQPEMNTPDTVLTPATTDDAFCTPPSSSSGRVEDVYEPTQATPAGQRPNLAPRAHEISAAPSDDNILPEGSKRERKKRRLTQFVLDTEEPSEFHHSFSAALTEGYRAMNEAPVPVAASQDPNKLKIHRDSLPPEPKGWRDLSKHPFGKQFITAAHTEFEALKARGTFREVPRQPQHQPLPLLWVFKYKFDTDGYLSKFKARICVRGDLQTSQKDNYAATLAIRYFRALMALSAAFDLEIMQLDAVNAFLNSNIDEDVTIEWPPGFQQNNRVLQLLKALYGLKQSPRLWHNHLVNIATKLGLKRVPGVNCVLVNSWVIFFFYVDDIILLFAKEDASKAQELVHKLQRDLELREITDANWFLGIRIVRDRPRRLLWLCQDSYIDKITARFDIKHLAQTPLPADIPDRYEGEASASDRHGFQSRVGSINFAAVVTRPDVAKAVSILSQHLQNPSPEHIRLANRVLAYLSYSKYLAIEYGGILEPSEVKLRPFAWLPSFPFECYSDAAFADNTDRKSSDGYLFSLYNGPIDWKASKQATVTTSTTEAELLALSRSAKELLCWQRFFDHIDFSFDGGLVIQSDNRQTIRLLKAEEPLLTTRLRHVDIHQHWLRQEVQEGTIDVEWVSTSAMKADGLTKPLPRQAFERFTRQLNLVNIQAEIEQQSRPGRVC